MKVLMINSVCGIRSTGRICTDIASVLAENGHDCRIAYGRENVPERYKDIAVRIGNDVDIRLHGLKSRLLDGHGFGSRRATERFIDWVKEYDPDVIHLHNIHGYYINVEVLFNYLKSSGKRVVWTLHDCWAFTGHCSNLVGCDKWKKCCHSCGRHKNYPSSFIDFSRRNYEIKKELFTSVENMTIVTPSKWLADLARQSFLNRYNIEVINNGIDLNVFKPTYGTFVSDNGLSDKKIVLGVASTWTKNKGFDDFVKLSQIIGDEYKVVLVGLSEEQKNSLDGNILGITRTNNAEQLAEIYTSACVFVNPTYNDNYPTVNLEAQACGTPVITYNTGGSIESVMPECVVEQGDVESLVKKITSKECYDEDCLEKAKLFDKKLMCKAYLDIFCK